MYDRPRTYEIGRHVDCDVSFPEREYDSISKRHCRIREEEDTLYVADLDSRNGTCILRNGAKTPVTGRVPLQSGDHLMLGDVEFQVAVIMPVSGSSAKGES